MCFGCCFEEYVGVCVDEIVDVCVIGCLLGCCDMGCCFVDVM